MASPTDDDGFQVGVSRRCRELLKNYLRHDDGTGQWSSGWPLLSKHVYIVESEEECQNPWCPDREEIAEPHDHHDHDEPSDPSLCDCDDPSRRDMHTRILGHIAQLEKLYRELVVAHKVTITLHAQAKPMRSVDPSVPPDGSRGQLEALGRMMMELELDGDKIQTQAGRPLCMVWCPSTHHCHHGKMRRYAPANCSCTPTACSCTNCILAHVEHCVEDYEEALARVRLDITKLRAMPRKETSYYPSASAEASTSNGSAMPGVRKAKHLKNYTKAQKDAHNGGK